MCVNNPVESMSIINPRLCKQLDIQVEIVQQHEGPIPHVHVYHDKTRDLAKCSYIRLDKAAYYVYHPYSMFLPDHLKNQFIEVMATPWTNHIIETSTGYRSATGYEAAVGTWVDTYEHGDYSKFNLDGNGDLIPVNYSNL